MDNEKPKAYLYIRVATAEQLETHAELQEKKLREYAQAAGYEVVGKTLVPGSAAENYPILQRLAIDREYRGNASVILAADPSRMTRDMHSLLGVTQAFSMANIHVEFADGTGDLSQRLGFLSALHIEQPEMEDSGEYDESDDLDEGFCQSM